MQQEVPEAKSPAEFAQANGIGLTTTYKLIREQKLRAVKVGRSTRILKADEEAWRASLPPSSGATPKADPLAMLRAPAPSLRIAHKQLGREYAKPRPVAELPPSLPYPKAPTTDREPLFSVAAWYRRTAPETGWQRVATVDADGSTCCFQCNRVMSAGWPMMRLHHEKNDLEILTCWPCGSEMRGKPVENYHSPMMTSVVLATFRDERLWSSSADGKTRMLGVSQDCGATVRVTDRGHYALSVDLPDMLDCPQYVGTYETMGEVQLRAFEAIREWEQKG